MASCEREDVMSRETPEQVLKSIVDGINTGNLDALMTLYEPDAAFASQPGSLAHGRVRPDAQFDRFVESVPISMSPILLTPLLAVTMLP